MVLSVVVLLLAGLYALGYVLAGDQLPRNATVAGVAVGGLDREVAIATVTEANRGEATRPIGVTVAGETDEVDPAQAGLSVDYAASVRAAGGGRSADPRRIWRVLTGGAQTALVRRTDDAKLAAAVQDLAARHDSTPRDAKLAYDGSDLQQTKARAGVAVRADEAAAALERSYLRDRGPVTVPAEITEPEITTEEMEQVAESFGAPAVAAPVRLQAGGEGRVKITPRMIAKAITFVPANGTLEPRLDPKRLRKAADKAIDDVVLSKPQDATVRLKKGKPVVIPAVNGTSIAAEDLARAVEPLLTKTGQERRGTVSLSGAAATFGTADAEALGVEQVTGKFTTYFPYAEYRNVNIGRAAEKINNTLLKPGDTFSLNKIVGERTKANGFIEGYIIKSGKFKKELGGGVSQSATTSYNAMFFAGLTDVEHRPHTLYINRYPAGREATVAWPNLDLKFRNDTQYGVLVQAFISKASSGRRGSITVKMWSTPTYDKITSSELAKSNFTTGEELTDDAADCEPQAPVQGFDVNYSRRFSNDGKVVRREKFFWRYAPTDRVRCE